jgi:hypothetical protein
MSLGAGSNSSSQPRSGMGEARSGAVGQHEAGSLTARMRLGPIKEEAGMAGSASAATDGICASDTKRALDWLEQHFGGSSTTASPAVEAEQIVAALRDMLGAAAAAAADDPLRQRQTSSSNTPMRSSISFAEDVEQRQCQRGSILHLCQTKTALHESYPGLGVSSSSNISPASRAPTIAGRMLDLKSPRAPAYPGHKSASPAGLIYRPISAQQQQQQARRRSSDHMRMASSWDSPPTVGVWGAPSPRGNGGGSSSTSKARSGRLGSSGIMKGSAGSSAGLLTGGGNGVLLADDPAFQEACKVCLQHIRCCLCD